MDAVRCLNCGETRWSLSGGSVEHLLAEPCRACGGEMAEERRRPGMGQRKPFVEQRDHEALTPGSRRGRVRDLT